MRFDEKLLGCLVSLALGAAPWPAEVLAKTNKKAVILSGEMAAVGSGRRIAGNGADTFIAVWADSNTSEIYGRYLRKDAPLGDAFKVGDWNSESEREPALSVAMNPDGDAVVCWAEGSDLDGNYYTPPNLKVFCRRVSYGEPAVVVSPLVAANALNNPANSQNAAFLSGVAIDDSGDFIVVWQDFGKTGLPIMARRFDRSGAAKGAAMQVAADSRAFAYSMSAPSVAVDADGDAVVVWSEGIDYYDPNNAIYARRIDKNGTLPQPKFRVDQSTPEDDGDYSGDDKALFYTVMSPAVAMDDAGNFAVTWLRQRRDSQRQSACGDGYVCFTYSAATEAAPYVQRFDQNDGPLLLNEKTSFPEDLPLAKKTQKQYLSPEIAMDPAGNFVVSWQENQPLQNCYTDEYGTNCEDVGLTSLVFTRKFNQKKKRFGAIKKIAKPNKSFSENRSPSVAMLDDGSFSVLWTEADYESGYMSATARFVRGRK